jgi:hypothetical protein
MMMREVVMMDDVLSSVRDFNAKLCSLIKKDEKLEITYIEMDPYGNEIGQSTLVTLGNEQKKAVGIIDGKFISLIWYSASERTSFLPASIRLKVYEQAKNVLLRHDANRYGLCFSLELAMNELREEKIDTTEFSPYLYFNRLPEFLEQMPNSANPGGYWWVVEDREPRMTAINTMIERAREIIKMEEQ